MKVKYVGPYAVGVVLPTLGLRVGPGETVEVPDELAEGLLVQEGTWAASRSKASNTDTAPAPDEAPADELDPVEDEIT